MYETGKLYEVDRDSLIGLSSIAIRILGTSPSITIYGSNKMPNAVSEMQDISSEDSPLVGADYYNYATLTKFISFVGTADSIYIDHVDITEIKTIS